MGKELAEIINGEIQFNPHPGQYEAWNAMERFIAVIAGTQGG